MGENDFKKVIGLGEKKEQKQQVVGQNSCEKIAFELGESGENGAALGEKKGVKIRNNTDVNCN